MTLCARLTLDGLRRHAGWGFPPHKGRGRASAGCDRLQTSIVIDHPRDHLQCGAATLRVTMNCPVCSDFDVVKLARRPAADTDAFSELLAAVRRGCGPCRLVWRVLRTILDPESFSKITQINFNYFPSSYPDDADFSTGLAPLFRAVLGFQEGYWSETMLVEEDDDFVERPGPPWEIELYRLPGELGFVPTN